MTATAAVKTGVTDTAAGANVHEYLGLKEEFGDALSQVVSPIPFGDSWQLKASLTFTPTLISDVLPPHPVMGWKVPSGKALLFTGGVVHVLAATLEYYRVCRRLFLFGWQGTAAPAAPAAPTVALLALTDGIAAAGAFTYKIAPIDTFRREGTASVASASVTLTATQRGVTVTPPAAGTGVIGYNIYRTLAGGAIWYFVGTTFGATAYLDAQPDSAIDVAQIPAVTWVTGAVTGEVADGPCEVIIEIGSPVLTGVPTHLVYRGPGGSSTQAMTVAPTNTVGARSRFKPFGETANFVAAPTAAANLWRGLYAADTRTRHEEDYGVTAVTGINVAPTAGSFIVWGQQVIGVGQRGADPVAATIHAYSLIPTNPHGVLIPPLGEIVLEVGALSAGVAGVRDATMSGILLPTVPA